VHVVRIVEFPLDALNKNLIPETKDTFQPVEAVTRITCHVFEADNVVLIKAILDDIHIVIKNLRTDS